MIENTRKSYTKQEVIEAATKYFKGDELAADVWAKKYCLKDESSYYELTPDDMHWRIAKELARIESNYPNPIPVEEIYESLKGFNRIIPQGSPMSGIGNNFQVVSLSNCFVIGNEGESDSYGGIMKLDQELVQLEKRRGGVGLDLSFVRPMGSPVKNSAITSTGVVPFMKRYSRSTNEVAQDGRRGALMESISIRHPDSEAFIDAKLIQGEVTGANISIKAHDDFMKAATEGTTYTQQYPIIGTPKYTKVIDAQKLWKKIIYNAWKSAEPGVLFWDQIIRESIPDCYNDLGYKTISTNPCIVGDTLIAVADGRNFISIKQLAEDGKDIPVYCLDNDGKLSIRTMRNPRVTGYHQQVYKITLEGGHTTRVTSNHKFRLKDGSYVDAKDLKYGDSLHILTKYQSSIKEIFPKANSISSDYFWLNNGEFKNNKSEHRFIYEQLNNIKIKTGNVIHHKNFNSLCNELDNLILMTKEEHDKYHSDNMKGDKNPYHRMTDEWKLRFSSHSSGELNSNFSGFSDEEIKNHAILLTKKLNRRFSQKDWIDYARENNLPQYFSKYRSYDTVVSLSKLAADELNIKFIHIDPRLVKSYENALNNGYNVEIKDGIVLVEKKCEDCGKLFWSDYQKREISFCSHKCALNYINNNINIRAKRTDSLNITYNNKGQDNKHNQLKIFKELEFELKRMPSIKEWKKNCKESNIPCRLKTKYGFKSFSKLKEDAAYFNHKVISVELDSFEDVYNGTVDEFHNFFSGGFQELTKSGKPKYLSINQLQCGEIPLCADDSCRLLCLNLFGYVINPFTEDAEFDYNLFNRDVIIAQRYMDDIIDLEIEKIDAILDKIESDPEDESLKKVERDLWTRIKKKTIKGRRTGLGVTGEGDMLAALGLRYGTDEATDFSVKIHRILKLGAYTSSVRMAKERGSFPIYDFKRELNNPFIERIGEEDGTLHKDMILYGRRNIALLTIAPTGTASLMTQTSSGIEPCFAPYYMRRRKINPQEKDARVDFIDTEGISWQEYSVFHHKFEIWLEVNGYDVNESRMLKDDQIKEIVKKSPYYRATANDVDWIKKVEMQGLIQQHVDHSISCTVNLPADVTEELVSKVYETGWRSGCKGITVYRDGSRSGVLLTNTDKKEPEEIHVPKRPKRLKAEIHRFQNNSEKWIAVVGIKDGRPYEIFTGKLENGLSTLSPSIKECEVVKNAIETDAFDDDGNPIKKKIKRYDIEYVDSNGVKQVHTGLNHAFNPEFWNYAKLVSGVLRHKMPMVYVFELVESLNFKNEDHINTWKNGVVRVIKKYVKDGVKAKGKCHECGSENLHFVEGCLLCQSCGSSKCG